jgi:hypothetical protein
VPEETAHRRLGIFAPLPEPAAAEVA